MQFVCFLQITLMLLIFNFILSIKPDNGTRFTQIQLFDHFFKFSYYNINNPMLFVCVCVSNVYLLLLNTPEAAQKILSEKLWAWSYDSMNRFKNRQRKQEVGKVRKDNICILFLLSPSSGWPRMTHISLSECLQWLRFFFFLILHLILYHT